MKKLVAVLMALVLCVSFATATADSLKHFDLNLSGDWMFVMDMDLPMEDETVKADAYMSGNLIMMVMDYDVVGAVAGPDLRDTLMVLYAGDEGAKDLLSSFTSGDSYENVSDVKKTPAGIAYVTCVSSGSPALVATHDGWVIMAVISGGTMSDLDNVAASLSLK